MESIYSNSTFTIVAADSEHANHGIHGVSLKRREPATYTDSQRDLTLGVGSILALLQDTKWGGRAWTFQEALCSCRMLVFTQYMCGLICPKTVQREDGWIEASNQSAPNLPLSPDFAFIKVNVGNDWNRTLYDDIVSIYTARSLTQEKDIIDAFSGTMARAKDWWGDFWYGLPRNAFLYALSWANHHAAHRIFVTLDDALRWNRHPIAPRIGFPSWSWVGWIHPIGSSLSFATGTTRKTVAMYRLTESGTLILVNDPTLPPGSAGLKAGARDLLQFPDEEEELGKVKDKLLGSKIPLEPLLILRTTIFHVVVPQYPETPETGGWAIYRIMPFEDMQICKPHVAKFQESLVQLNCEWRASQPDKLEFALLGVTNVSSVSLQQPFSLITIVLARENGLCSRAGLTEFSLENFWEVDSEEILADIARHSLPETIVLT